MRRLISFFLLIAFFTQSYAISGLKILCIGETKEQNLNFTKSEIQTLFGKVLEAEGVTQTYTFKLKINDSYRNGKFSHKSTGNREFTLEGEDAISVTNALHSLLEKVGYTFDISGITVPSKFNLNALKNLNEVITPKVRYRGIRQHVNFSMDISSYPIEEAKEYLRNLVRLRFNKITIHSYPGHWYNEKNADNKAFEYAGDFFYGHKHHMFGNELFKKVRFNDTLFCMPLAEKIYDNEKTRSKVAMNWMRQLISYSKELGFRVQFSMEPRLYSVEKTVEICKSIIKSYPGIDDLELITEETGGWGSKCTDQEVLSTLNKYFPPEIAKDSVVLSVIRPTQPDLNNLYTQIGIIAHSIEVLSSQRTITDKNINLKAGIYCSVNAITPAAYRLARLASPKLNITLMPSHGSDGTAEVYNAIVKTKEDAMKTEVYSWIEFDGLMYLQQNSINGNAKLMDNINQLENGQQYSLLFNHWRTAENRTSARFASEVTLFGSTNVNEFYRQYADRLGISDKYLYVKAMLKLNEVDSYSKYFGNIGFCWVGAWKNGGIFNGVNIHKLETAKKIHLEVGEMLTELMKNSSKPSAKEYLKFLGNRILASVVYLNAFIEAAQIRTIIKDKSGNISPEEQKRAVDICNHALMTFEQFMGIYAQMMPDRGCEGTLVSVWNSPMMGLKVWRSKLGGVPLESAYSSEIPLDAPPLPIFDIKE
ncbi:MAG TPA: hypothetical protein DEH15_14080 [Marinilabiliales bacterium]|nr:hypothetical protein [Marinilabiliales bacterium]